MRHGFLAMQCHSCVLALLQLNYTCTISRTPSCTIIRIYYQKFIHFRRHQNARLPSLGKLQTLHASLLSQNQLVWRVKDTQWHLIADWFHIVFLRFFVLFEEYFQIWNKQYQNYRRESHHRQELDSNHSEGSVHPTGRPHGSENEVKTLQWT